MNHPTPTRADHEKFCRIEGWTSVRNARGSETNHHVTYELALPDGNVLRTRVSHPIDRSDYGPALWSHVLRDQLKMSSGIASTTESAHLEVFRRCPPTASLLSLCTNLS